MDKMNIVKKFYDGKGVNYYIKGSKETRVLFYERNGLHQFIIFNTNYKNPKRLFNICKKLIRQKEENTIIQNN